MKILSFSFWTVRIARSSVLADSEMLDSPNNTVAALVVGTGPLETAENNYQRKQPIFAQHFLPPKVTRQVAGAFRLEAETVLEKAFSSNGEVKYYNSSVQPWRSCAVRNMTPKRP